MRRVELTTRVEASPERVFEILTDHEGMVRWSGAKEAVLRHPGDPPPNGVGAVRVLRMSGFAIEEEILAYDPPKRMEYRLLAGVPIRDHHGEIRVDPDASGSRVVWSMRFRPRIPGTGWLMERITLHLLSNVLTRLTNLIERS
jgi:uncharacterized protein YndB with AHSA1/START domain